MLGFKHPNIVQAFDFITWRRSFPGHESAKESGSQLSGTQVSTRASTC
jgi:hypothetical protein